MLTTQDPIVVTPSGHVCLQRLLLSKLAENGNIDPFDVTAQRPLREEQLILLAPQQQHNTSTPLLIPPRPNHATSYSNLLQLLHSEYDAVVLELFDTRMALQSTRKELSHALYQNDAAIRVIARLAKERDEARQEMMMNTNRGNASHDANATTTTTTTTTTTIPIPILPSNSSQQSSSIVSPRSTQQQQQPLL